METGANPSITKRLSDSWRELGRKHASQVLVGLGSGLAIFAALVVYLVRAAAQGSPVVVSAEALWLFVFGVLGLVGYVVSRTNARNGAVVAGVAALGLLIVARGPVGFLTGLVVLVGAAWGLLRSL